MLTTVLIISLMIWNTYTVTYENQLTESYCALATSFKPTPDLFVSIVGYCKNTSYVPSISCNDSLCQLSSEGYVEDDLSILSLTHPIVINGSIPTQIGYLSNLTKISLSIQLSGSLPTQLGNLRNLNELNVYSPVLVNHISGTIPTQLGKLTNLRILHINIEYNYIIPGVGFNYPDYIIGTIPTQLGSLVDLRELDLNFCRITGTIPTQLGNLSNLTKLSLKDNLLSATIPRQLGNLTSLKYLHVGKIVTLVAPAGVNPGPQFSFWVYPQISGTIPTQIGKLTSLTFISLFANTISGAIPTQIGYLTSLVNLSASRNLITSIPTQIGNLRNLSYLDISNNKLSSTIPTEIGNLKSISSFSLRDNQISGTIPTQIGKMTSNTFLSLWSNQLTGTIPTQIGLMKNLQYLHLIGNQISGTISTQFGYLNSLTWIDLSFNKLSGNIPTQMGKLINLTTLTINSNQLSLIPTQLGNLINLTSLSFNSNQLSGTLPTQIGNLRSLKEINIKNNELSGSIPTQLGNLAKLTKLSLDYNELSGSIPTQLGNLAYLSSLYLDNNQISGPIPTHIGNLTRLTTLALYYNAISGSLPTQIGQLTSLRSLDVSSNQLSGSIPSQLGNLRNIDSIHIYYNQISGSIPIQIGNSTKLTDLDLSWNKLSGSIPSQIGNLTNLIILNLNNNNISGTAPSEIINLTKLYQINLSTNNLYGTLPKNFLLWKFSIISLENNHFNGTIDYLPTAVNFLFSNNEFSTICLNQLTSQIRSTIKLSNNKITDLTCSLRSSDNYIPGFASLDLSFNPLKYFPTIFYNSLQELKIVGCGLNGSLTDFLTIVSNNGLKYLDISNNSLSGTIPPLKLNSLETLILSNNNISGVLPDQFPPYLKTLLISKNNISGSIPSALSQIPLNEIDLSQTQMCTPSFPSEWNDKQWVSCNLQIAYPCENASSLLSGCLLNSCVVRLSCYSDQCASGTHNCKDGRICLSQPDWRYDCSDCTGIFYANDGAFNCVSTFQLDKLAIPIVVIVAIIIIVVILRLKLRKLDLFLPQNWLWESKYYLNAGYSKSTTNPEYFWKEIDVDSYQTDDSKEAKLFQFLQGMLDFEDIIIKKITVISSPILAQSMSNWRKITLQRMKTSPALFKSNSWEQKSEPSLRLKILKHFQRQCMQFHWNHTVEDCPVLAVAHATDIKKANKIIATGFASLSTLDEGWYGKGIYFSSSAIYTVPYFVDSKNVPCIILCYILPGNPYPVIEKPKDKVNLRGKTITTGYQSHYVVTTRSGVPTKEEYTGLRQYNEIVVNQEAQALPIFLLEIEQTNFPELKQKYQREIREITEYKDDAATYQNTNLLFSSALIREDSENQLENYHLVPSTLPVSINEEEVPEENPEDSSIDIPINEEEVPEENPEDISIDIPKLTNDIPDPLIDHEKNHSSEIAILIEQ